MTIKKEILSVAIVQQDIVWQVRERNYALVEKLLEQALDRNVDVIVVPETFSTAFTDDMSSMAEEKVGATYDFALRMARRYDALFVGTWVVRDGESASAYNRMHLVAPDGLLGAYDKHHTFRLSSEAQQIARGEGRITTEWRGWNIRPAICYDLRFPTWLRNTYNAVDGDMDYDLLLLSANWPKTRIAVWDTLLKARAIENLSYVVGVNRTGIDANGLVYNGHSMAVDYAGHVITNTDNEGQGVTVVDLDYEELAAFRRKCPFYLDFD